MSRPFSFFAVLLPVLVAGCRYSSPTTVDAQSRSAERPAKSVAMSGATTNVIVTDPTLGNMKAATLTIPSHWKFQGIMFTSACSPLPWSIYRAYSPDGLSEMRAMPVVGWRWSRYNTPLNGCLPLKGTMSAAEFLNKYIETIPGGVHVVGPAPVTPAFSAATDAFLAARKRGSAMTGNRLHAEETGDAAALRIETVNGSFELEQRLRAVVFCQTIPAGPLQGGNCWARVEVVRAPKGKLDALLAVVDGQSLPHGVNDPEWEQKFANRMIQQAQAELNATYQVGNRALLQAHQQFMATMQHNHEAFMAQQESSFRSSMANANASMNARSTAASDWVDYALDQQTVVGQGGTAKISNAYSHTWSSTVGNQTTWYQTNDPNANPNGVLSGNWSEDTKVHGNGQPY